MAKNQFYLEHVSTGTDAEDEIRVLAPDDPLMNEHIIATVHAVGFSERIINALNCHDELLQALEDWLAYVPSGEDEVERAIIDRARIVATKAKGR